MKNDQYFINDVNSSENILLDNKIHIKALEIRLDAIRNENQLLRKNLDDLKKCIIEKGVARVLHEKVYYDIDFSNISSSFTFEK